MPCIPIQNIFIVFIEKKNNTHEKEKKNK